MHDVQAKQAARHLGFTIVEVAAALVLLGLLLASTLTLMNRYADTVIDMQLREQAFDIARSNMERLLSENTLSDKDEYGTDEFNPELDWEVIVEPFYEPVTNQMWIRAVCTSGFLDTQGERQNVELEHWITNLTPEQIKKIKAQQEAEQEYMDLLQGGQLSDVQKATVAFLLQEQMDIEAYRKFLKQQLRQKLEFLSEKGFEGYEPFLLQLEDDENVFLQKLGMDFDKYNEFVKTFDPATFNPEEYFSSLNERPSGTNGPEDPEGTQGPETLGDNPLDFLPPNFLDGE